MLSLQTGRATSASASSMIHAKLLFNPWKRKFRFEVNPYENVVNSVILVRYYFNPTFLAGVVLRS